MWQNLAKNRPFSGKDCQKMRILTRNIKLTALFRLKYLFWASPKKQKVGIYTMKVQLNTLTEWNLQNPKTENVAYAKLNYFSAVLSFDLLFFCWIRNLIYFLKTLMLSNLEDFLFCLMSTPQPTVNRWKNLCSFSQIWELRIPFLILIWFKNHYWTRVSILTLW